MLSRFYAAMFAVGVLSLPQSILAQVAPGAPVQTATVQGTVTDSHGKPVANAIVRLVGPSSGQTSSNSRGEFEFTNVTLGTYAIYVNSVYGEASKGDVVVNGDITVAVNYLAPSGLRTIAHVSTTGGVTINVTPASIAALSPSNYAFQGVTSWRQILEQIPGVAATGDTYGGGDTNDTIPNGPFQPVVLSINGAQPYETATLLDGMPIVNISFSAVPGAGTDLGTLPLNAFDSAAVVRGPGAESPSILDAIGGAFLFHGPTPATQNLYEFSYTTDPWGGLTSDGKVALSLGRFSSELTFGVWDSPGPENAQVIDAFGFDDFPKINGQAVSCPVTASRPSWLDYGCFIERNPPTIQPWYAALEGTGYFCCVHNSNAWDTRSGSGALSYHVGSEILAQVFYAGAMNRALQTGWFYPTLFDTPAPGYTGSLSPGMHSFIDITYNSPELESDSLLEEKVRANLGQGVLQIAAVQNNSWGVQRLGYDPAGNYTAYGEACLGTATGPPSSTPGSCAPGTTLTVFNGTPIYGGSYSSTYNPYDWNGVTANRDMTLSYDTQLGEATTAGVSFLKSYYDYWYTVIDLPFYNSGYSPSYSETSREYHVHVASQLSDKLYANLSWYFTSGDYHLPDPRFVQNLQHPGHYADAYYPYSTPRLALVWRASPDIAIRAAAGGGYALQSILYQLGSNGTPMCSGGQCTLSLENINLRPEKSFGVDVGTDVRFDSFTALSIDLYQTNLFGMFFESGSIEGTYHGFPLLVTEYRNLPEARMEGVNLSVQHNVPHGIFWHGAFGLTRGFVVSVPPGFYNNGGICRPFAGWSGGATLGDTYCTNTEITPGANFTGAGYSGIAAIPYANGYGAVGYRWTPKTYVQLEADYFGKNNSYYEPPFAALNGYIGYGVTPHITLLANFQNITCVYCLSYEQFLNYPSVIAAASPGQLPYGLNDLPYGPRTVILTANIRY